MGNGQSEPNSNPGRDEIVCISHSANIPLGKV